MQRVFVTGNAGAGKSTVARSLGKSLGFPVYSLDEIVWQPGWQKTPAAKRAKQINELIGSSNQWVIEGVSNAVLEASDTVIFLDAPRHVCLWRCAKRNRHYLFRSRPDLPEHCPELLIIPQLLRTIWNFPKDVRPGILKHLEDNKHRKTVRIVKNSNRFNALTFPCQLNCEPNHNNGR
jgi:adenylate kinase family enzyme